VSIIHFSKELEAMNDVKINIWGFENKMTENYGTCKYSIKDFMEKSDPNAIAEYLYKNLDFTVDKKKIKSRIHSSTLALENIFLSNKVSSLRIDVCFITPIMIV